MTVFKNASAGAIIVAWIFWVSAPVAILIAYITPVTISARVTPWPQNLQSHDFHVGNGLGQVDSDLQEVSFRYAGPMSLADREIFLSRSSDPAYRTAVDVLYTDRSYFVVLAFSALWLAFVVGFEIWRWLRNRILERTGFGDQIHCEAGYDIRLIGVFFIFSTFISVILVWFDVFVSHGSAPTLAHSFWRANVDFFLIGAFILTTTGCIYAVYAKLVADSVFDATQAIQRAVTGFIGNFNQVMDPTLDNSAPAIIRTAQRNLILYIGNPIAGFFRDEQAGRAFQLALIERINKAGPGFKLQMICWGDKQETDYLQKNPQKAEQYKKLRSTLFERISETDGCEIHFLPDGIDPPFRFVVADSRRAILWVLQNPTPSAAAEEGDQNNPKAGGFTTEMSNMIRVLEGVFKAAVDRLIADAEPPPEICGP